MRQHVKLKWNLIRLGGQAHGIVTKTVHKTLPGVGGSEGVVGVKGWWGEGVSRGVGSMSGLTFSCS